jgi:hypothetical protein
MFSAANLRIKQRTTKEKAFFLLLFHTGVASKRYRSLKKALVFVGKRPMEEEQTPYGGRANAL